MSFLALLMKCPSCGTEVWGNIDTCPVCGQSLSSAVKAKKRELWHSNSEGVLGHDYEPDLQPGEKIIEEFKPEKYPFIMTLFRSFGEVGYLIPILAGAYTASPGFFSAYWLETTVLPLAGLLAAGSLTRHLTGLRRTRKVRYFVTDRRLIAVRGSNPEKQKYMMIGNVGSIRITRVSKVAYVTFFNSRLIGRMNPFARQRLDRRAAASASRASKPPSRLPFKRTTFDLVNSNLSSNAGSYLPPSGEMGKVRTVYSLYKEQKTRDRHMLTFYYISNADAENVRKIVLQLAETERKNGEARTNYTSGSAGNASGQN